MTVLSYILLSYYVGANWSGWLLLLPVLLDWVIIQKVGVL